MTMTTRSHGAITKRAAWPKQTKRKADARRKARARKEQKR